MSTNKLAVFSSFVIKVFILILFLAAISNAQPNPTRKVLTVNRPSYVVGEYIIYRIKGAVPNSLILWSSWKDGISTGEVDICYGHRTDAFGNWSVRVGPWTDHLIGSWKKQVKIGGYVYTVTFQVQPGPLSDFTSKVGQYFWSPPQYFPNTIDYAADRISQLGGHAMHLAFFAGCNPQTTLLQRAQMNDARMAFGNPDIKVYLLTTYGASGCGFDGKVFFDPKAYPAAAPLIERDYKALTLHLYQTYAGTGKRFVISTWEGDNVLHCGAAYHYARNSRLPPGPDGVVRDAYGNPMPVDPNDPAGRSVPFRDYCNAIYPQIGIASPDEAHEGYRLWLEARQRGVRQGREEAAAQGYSGVEVYHAPEFNVINLLEYPKENGQLMSKNGAQVRFKSLLRDVLPNLETGFDFVSYSAYETTNLKLKDESTESLQTRVASDLDTIEQILGTRNIIIGEFGYQRYSADNRNGLTDDQVVRRTEEVLDAALDWGVEAIFTWQMFDDQWGTFDSQGNMLPLGRYFWQRYFRR